MKHIELLILAGALALGCGNQALVTDIVVDAGDDDSQWGDPVWAPDVSGWLDGEQERFCEQSPDDVHCGELGVTTEAWTSAEYHGWGADNRPCYSAATATGDCIFPMYKQAKYTFDKSKCLDNTVPILQAQAIIDALEQGIMLWNGAGSGVTVSPTSGSQLIAVSCAPLGGNDLGSGGLDGAGQTQIANLPVGPHGKDELRAIQENHSHERFDVQRIFDFYNSCDATQTLPELKQFAKFTGAHETGHAFGYAHFTSGTMKVGAGCADHAAGPNLTLLGNALGKYVGSVGAATIIDNGLQTFGP